MWCLTCKVHFLESYPWYNNKIQHKLWSIDVLDMLICDQVDSENYNNAITRTMLKKHTGLKFIDTTNFKEKLKTFFLCTWMSDY